MSTSSPEESSHRPDGPEPKGRRPLWLRILLMLVLIAAVSLAFYLNFHRYIRMKG